MIDVQCLHVDRKTAATWQGSGQKCRRKLTKQRAYLLTSPQRKLGTRRWLDSELVDVSGDEFQRRRYTAGNFFDRRVWRFGNGKPVAGLVQRWHVALDQRSYSTLGPVSAWVGDRLWTGKPPRRRTMHPGLLSPWARPLWLGWNEYPAKLGGKQAYRVIH